MNWATLESIVDAAELAYRRRFLIDKYPQLADDAPIELVGDDDDMAGDEAISVLDVVLHDAASEVDEGSAAAHKSDGD
ncbi:hypothetical protein [Microbacterium sp.]|uniref:hypothetical protein n=1 Tax=Microbacterium sp. TaxID=51671 RepID=UPI0039E5123F